MSKQKSVLKKMTYEDYIYYNGKCRENNGLAREIKTGKKDYYVFFKNDKPLSDLYVDIKDTPDVPYHRLEEVFKESHDVIDVLLKIYNELKISSFATHINEEEEVLNYIKKHYKVIKEEINDYDTTFHNGKNVESVSITIKNKKLISNIKVVKGTYEDYLTWLGRLYIEEDKIAQKVKKGDLNFFLIFNNDKYLDHFCIDENNENKINLLIHFDTIVNTHKEVLKELKKYYTYLSFEIDSSYYKEAYNILKSNYNIIEEKKIPYSFAFENEVTSEVNFIKIKL